MRLAFVHWFQHTKLSWITFASVIYHRKLSYLLTAEAVVLYIVNSRCPGRAEEANCPFVAFPLVLDDLDYLVAWSAKQQATATTAAATINPAATSTTTTANTPLHLAALLLACTETTGTLQKARIAFVPVFFATTTTAVDQAIKGAIILGSTIRIERTSLGSDFKALSPYQVLDVALEVILQQNPAECPDLAGQLRANKNLLACLEACGGVPRLIEKFLGVLVDNQEWPCVRARLNLLGNASQKVVPINFSQVLASATQKVAEMYSTSKWRTVKGITLLMLHSAAGTVFPNPENATLSSGTVLNLLELQESLPFSLTQRPGGVVCVVPFAILVHLNRDTPFAFVGSSDWLSFPGSAVGENFEDLVASFEGVKMDALRALGCSTTSVKVREVLDCFVLLWCCCVLSCCCAVGGVYGFMLELKCCVVVFVV